MYLPFLTFPPIGIIDGGLWPGDKWLPRSEMKREMNDFTLARASEAWDQGVLTLWQIHWPWQANLDRATGDVGVARVHCGSFADDASAHSIFSFFREADVLPEEVQKVAAGQPAGASERHVFYGCEAGSAQWKRGGQENTCSKVRGRSKWRWKPPLFARQDLQATASYFSLLVLSLMPHNWEAANVDKNQFNDYMTSHLF